MDIKTIIQDKVEDVARNVLEDSSVIEDAVMLALEDYDLVTLITRALADEVGNIISDVIDDAISEAVEEVMA